MNRNKIRLMFTGLVGFLFLQFLFVLVVSEPYPAVRFPGFGRIPVKEGKIEVTDYELHLYSTKNQYTIIEAKELFADFPETYVPSMLSNIVENQDSTSGDEHVDEDYPEFIGWVNNRLYKMYNKTYHKLVVNKVKARKKINSMEEAGETTSTKKAELLLKT